MEYHTITLYGKNAQERLAKVSHRWAAHVDKHKWYVDVNGYAFAFHRGRLKLHRYIHKLIVGHKTPLYVDHKNRDRLDNTDENLREATAAENAFNKSYKNKDHNIKLKKSSNTYEVCIQKEGKMHKVNDIETIEQAREMYKLMAEELFGHFAPTD